MLALLLAAFMAQPLRQVAFETPPPFRDAVMAVEWAPSPATMDVVLGKAPERPERIRALLEATRRDGLFILAYTLFMCGFAVTMSLVSRHRYYLLLGVVALVVGFADLGENGAIRSLLLLYDSETFTPGGSDYLRVRLFAWVKWAGTALYFAGVGPYLWSRGWFIGRVLALLAASVVIMWILAQFSALWAEPYALGVFGLLALATAYCFRPVKGLSDPQAGP